MLCKQFVDLGHEVRVATLTSSQRCLDLPYPVYRNPSMIDLLKLLQWSDVNLQANISLKYIVMRIVARRTTIYQHNGPYQLDNGRVRFVDRLKRRLAQVTPGIANSPYTASKIGCTRVVLNAYDDAVFSNQSAWQSRDKELVFLGRLVSQKGCDVLLRALKLLRLDGLTPGLTIIGDGPERPKLEALALEYGIGSQVSFLGTLQGQDLAKELNRHRFVVVPSNIEEPFGIAALEALACGCVPVVSERGGLVDAIGGHGFTFPNGDEVGLAQILLAALQEPDGALRKLAGVDVHLKKCTARSVAQRYLDVFAETVRRSS